MIGYLEGTPKITGQTLLIIVAGGVGYEVRVAGPAMTRISSLNQTALYIYTFVREDRLELYGFESLEDKQLFSMLLGVSGVGPGTALTISGVGYEPLVSAVQEGKVAFFTAIPRVGKKVAQKIIIDLSSKLGELKSLQLGVGSARSEELVQSLVGLGFNEIAARESVGNFDLDTTDDSTILKMAIKHLSQK